MRGNASQKKTAADVNCKIIASQKELNSPSGQQITSFLISAIFPQYSASAQLLQSLDISASNAYNFYRRKRGSPFPQEDS